MFETTRYQTKAVASIDSPALLLYEDLVHQNIGAALNIMKGKSTFIRPHVKTVKCEEVVKLSLEKGIDRFKCSTVAEAELLAHAGAKDVLLSYQLSGVKAHRFSRLREMFPQTTFASLIDNPDSAKIVSEIFEKNELSVFIDVNVGMNRTGVIPDKATDLIRACKKLAGINIIGLHGYDGHVHSQDRTIRKEESDAIFDEMNVLRNKAEKVLDKKLKLVLGGSPSFSFYAKQSNVECSPGTIFFWDAGYGSNYPELPFVPAVVILTRILSIVDSDLLCFDLGSKAVAADPPQPRMVIPDLEDYEIVEQYEEHLVVRVPDTSKYSVGETYFAIPHHICPTVNLYEELNIIKGGRQSGTWKVSARNRKITV